MEAEQVQWASQLRKIPIRFHQALRSEDDRAIRHCPAMGKEILSQLCTLIQNEFEQGWVVGEQPD